MSTPSAAREASKSWIQTRSGLRADLETPRADAICIRDIAYALAHIYRYTGHADPGITVAEHSYFVSRHCETLGSTPEHRRSLARWGLLHDASEAYLGDVSSPLKRLACMAGYRVLEAQWAAEIFRKYELYGPPPDEVKRSDLAVLCAEARYAMAPVRADWGLAPAEHEGSEVTRVIGMDPDLAERIFLVRFRRLFGDAT